MHAGNRARVGPVFRSPYRGPSASVCLTITCIICSNISTTDNEYRSAHGTNLSALTTPINNNSTARETDTQQLNRAIPSATSSSNHSQHATQPLINCSNNPTDSSHIIQPHPNQDTHTHTHTYERKLNRPTRPLTNVLFNRHDSTNNNTTQTNTQTINHQQRAKNKRGQQKVNK